MKLQAEHCYNSLTEIVSISEAIVDNCNVAAYDQGVLEDIQMSINQLAKVVGQLVVELHDAGHLNNAAVENIANIHNTKHFTFIEVDDE